jgi:hypothetical protein
MSTTSLTVTPMRECSGEAKVPLMNQRGNSPPLPLTAWRALLKGDLVSEMTLLPGGRKSIPESSENWLVTTSPSERSEKEMLVVMAGLIDAVKFWDRNESRSHNGRKGNTYRE